PPYRRRSRDATERNATSPYNRSKMAWSVRLESSTTWPLSDASFATQRFNSTISPSSLTNTLPICPAEAATLPRFSWVKPEDCSSLYLIRPCSLVFLCLSPCCWAKPDAHNRQVKARQKILRFNLFWSNISSPF